jgi:ketosteroid isomerase-like protein
MSSKELGPTDAEQTIRAVAKRHTQAMAARDLAEIERIYARRATIWHNTDRRTLSVADHIASYARNTAALERIDYADIRLSVFDGGFLQQHVITAHLRDGRSFDIACCVVARVRDGLIVQLEEYLDSAAFLGVGLKTEH